MSILAFLVAVYYFPGVPDATSVGRWWVAAVGAACLLSRTPRLRLTPAHWWGAALLAWCALSFLWSSSLWDTVGTYVQLLTFAGVFCAAAEGEQNGRESRTPSPSPVVAFGLGLLPSAAASVAQALGYVPVLSISDHPVGLFLSKNGATEAALPVFVWCAVMLGGDALGQRRTGPDAWPWRALVLLAGASALLVAALAQAKEAWLMLAGAAFVAALHWARWEDERIYPRIPVTVIGVWAIAGGVALLGVTVAAMQPEDAVVTLDQRLAIWQATLYVWWMHPLLGWGFGTFGTVLPGMEYAHNEFVQFLFETGPVGLALLVAFFVAVFRSRADGAGVYELVARRSTLAALLASALVWWPLHQPASGFLVALLAGSLAGAGAHARAAEPVRRETGSDSVRQAEWPGRVEEVGVASIGGHGVAIES